jgi:hypothetical protein
MEYRRDGGEWSKDLRELAGALGDPLSIPPLIAEYHEGEPDLRLADGNTRYGAMGLLGWAKCWVIIWYNSEEDRRRHSHELGIEPGQHLPCGPEIPAVNSGEAVDIARRRARYPRVR